MGLGGMFGGITAGAAGRATRRAAAALALLAGLASCGPVVIATPDGNLPAPPRGGAVGVPPRQAPDVAARNFISVVERVEPVAESYCRRQAPGANCDFAIVVDDTPGRAPNAFQTLDENGRPVIGFTIALIAEARNRDELAFILGHEAAHHIEGHIPKAQQSALAGAVLGGVLAGLGGADAAVVRQAQNIGATLGSRRFSKGFELEADATGTRIAAAAGYDPVRGAEYFTRVPDPGNRFLGSHPPNADRIETVRRTAAGL